VVLSDFCPEEPSSSEGLRQSPQRRAAAPQSAAPSAAKPASKGAVGQAKGNGRVFVLTERPKGARASETMDRKWKRDQPIGKPEKRGAAAAALEESGKPGCS